jgi:hypothetical protein
MHSSNSSNPIGECYIPWDSVPTFGTLLRMQSDDFSQRISKVKFLEIKQNEAEKQ